MNDPDTHTVTFHHLVPIGRYWGLIGATVLMGLVVVLAVWFRRINKRPRP